jgi:hypothetical protein
VPNQPLFFGPSRTPHGLSLERSIQTCRRAVAFAIMGTRSAFKEVGEGFDEDGCSEENAISLPRMQS